MKSLFYLLCIACSLPHFIAQRLSEQDRVDLWFAEGNTWPPKWQEETEGMQKLMAHREHEMMTQIKGGAVGWWWEHDGYGVWHKVLILYY